MICGCESTFAFRKSWHVEPGASLMSKVQPVLYFRCSGCGFTFSQTHRELAREKWIELNEAYHNWFESSDLEHRTSNQPPYPEQAFMLALLHQAGLIRLDSALDFAGGQGTMHKLLADFFGLDFPIYDPYLGISGDPRYLNELPREPVSTVFNSAMFEHVLSRSDLDSVNALVRPDGVLIIHTVVCNEVPNDPSWFYLEPPVHTAFHTNASMEILMNQWGYKESLYCPQSKCWILFRKPPDRLVHRAKELNQRLQAHWFFHSDGFMAYWR